ncbi:MAG: hypothetical protein WCA46_26840 [Actinocatenispora sp.]
MNAAVSTDGGFATLGPAASELLDLLDDTFMGWARRLGAQPMTMPPLLSVDKLAKLDFYKNFPQLALVASTIDPEQTVAAGGEFFPPEALGAAGLALPSTVCYPVYWHFAGTRLPESTRVTVQGLCFRNEDHYDGLRRLMAFRMREVIALGSLEYTQEHLEQFAELIERFAAELNLPLVKHAATDPFFDKEGPRALLQKLVPVKHEFLFEGTAIASVNLHRNFFGERCDIRYGEDAQVAYTSCVGFGYERWLHALSQHFDNDWESIIKTVGVARNRVTG